jgi:hypothetical protein
LTRECGRHGDTQNHRPFIKYEIVRALNLLSLRWASPYYV